MRRLTVRPPRGSTYIEACRLFVKPERMMPGRTSHMKWANTGSPRYQQRPRSLAALTLQRTMAVCARFSREERLSLGKVVRQVGVVMDSLLRSPTVGEMHELRSRLTAAMLATELLRRTHPHSPDAVRLTMVLREVLTDVVRILNDLERLPSAPNDP